MPVVVLNQLPHTGEDSRSVALADRPEPSPEPLATGEFRLDGDFPDLREEGDDELLLEAATVGRIARRVAAAVAVIAVSVIVLVLLTGADSGAGTNVLAQAARVDTALEPRPVTSPPLTVLSAPTPSASAEEGTVLFVEPMEQMGPQLEALTPVTQLGEWLEPEVEPKGQWVDGGNGVRLPDVLLRIRFCESTNNYRAAHSASSARGAYQFLSKSWEWYGHAARYGVAAANLATPAQQDQAALLTFEQDGARPWAESSPCWADSDIDPRYLTAGPSPSTTTAPPATTTSTSNPSTPPTTAASTSTSTTSPSTTTASPSSTTTTAASSTTTSSSTTTGS